MKKFVLVFSVIMLGLSCLAKDIYPVSSRNTINGTVKTKGDTDIITVKSKSRLSDSFFRPTRRVGRAILRGISDPYIIEIEGSKYIMVKDKQTNNWSKQDLVGIEDTNETIFEGLKKLNSDNDYSKITAQELKKANIRFAKLQNNTLLVTDRKQDFDLDKIDYIDTLSLTRTANSQETGIFGHFYLYLKTPDNSKKVVVGQVTLDKESHLEILFK